MKVNFINAKLVFKSLIKDVFYTGRAEVSTGNPWKIDCSKNLVKKGDIIEIKVSNYTASYTNEVTRGFANLDAYINDSSSSKKGFLVSYLSNINAERVPDGDFSYSNNSSDAIFKYEIPESLNGGMFLGMDIYDGNNLFSNITFDLTITVIRA